MSNIETASNTICFKGILANTLESIKNYSASLKKEEKDTFSEINRSTGVYLNSRNKVTKDEDLKSFDLNDMEAAFADLGDITQAPIGKILNEANKNPKSQHIVRIFNALDLIIMHGAKVLENISSGVYRNLEEQSKIVIANFSTKFAEFKEQVADMLAHMAIFYNLKDKVEQFAQRWKLELKVF